MLVKFVQVKLKILWCKRKDFRGPKPAGKAIGGRIYKADGGVSEAAERLRRQGLKGGGICKKGMNRKAIGKNS